MSIAHSVFIPNSFRFVIIYVDSFEKKCLGGRIYHPSFNHIKSFNSLIELLLIMEGLFDDLSYPWPSMRIRTFQNQLSHSEKKEFTNEKEAKMHYLERKGKLGSFSVRVQFRRNASWQGTLRWIDKNKEEYFRSTLEMIMLMDNALCGGEGWNENNKNMLYNF